MDLSFLSNVKPKEVETKKRAPRPTLAKYPVEGADFRVYKNGRVFTAPATAEKYALEFVPKVEVDVLDKEGAVTGSRETQAGNGLDFFSSEDWQQVSFEQQILFMAITPRDGNSKIDVYGSTSYDEEGEPKRSIDTNTISTFAKEWLVPQLQEIYDVDFEENDFVDLKINEEYKIETAKGVYSLPKTVSRGEAKGEQVFITRKNIDVFPVTVFEAPAEETKQVDLEESIEEVTAEKEAAKVDATKSEEA